MTLPLLVPATTVLRDDRGGAGEVSVRAEPAPGDAQVVDLVDGRAVLRAVPGVGQVTPVEGPGALVEALRRRAVDVGGVGVVVAARAAADVAAGRGGGRPAGRADGERAAHPRVQGAVELVGARPELLDALDLGLLAAADQRRPERPVVADQVVLRERVEVGEDQRVALADGHGRSGVVHGGRVGTLLGRGRRSSRDGYGQERARGPRPCAHGLEVHPCTPPA